MFCFVFLFCFVLFCFLFLFCFVLFFIFLIMWILKIFKVGKENINTGKKKKNCKMRFFFLKYLSLSLTYLRNNIIKDRPPTYGIVFSVFRFILLISKKYTQLFF